MPTKHAGPTEAGEDAALPLRADIQQAALQLFATHGYENVTTQALAEQVGISPSTFLWHVPSKEHLLLGATQRGRAQIVANFCARPLDEDVVDSISAAILARTRGPATPPQNRRKR